MGSGSISSGSLMEVSVSVSVSEKSDVPSRL